MKGYQGAILSAGLSETIFGNNKQCEDTSGNAKALSSNRGLKNSGGQRLHTAIESHMRQLKDFGDDQDGLRGRSALPNILEKR